MLERIDKRTAGFDRRGDDLARVDHFDLEIDLAARDSRYVEQIVDQPDELPELANAPLGLSILYLLRQTETQAPPTARVLMARAV